MHVYTSCTSCPLCVLGSLGNSLDMRVQYCDSQSQWRLCMLVPLKRGNKCKRFPMKSHISIVLLFVKGLWFRRMDKEINVYVKTPKELAHNSDCQCILKWHTISARRWLSDNLWLQFACFVKRDIHNFLYFKIKSKTLKPGFTSQFMWHQRNASFQRTVITINGSGLKGTASYLNNVVLLLQCCYCR